MAKGFAAVEEQCRKAVQDIRNGSFAPVYLLMGDEPYYPDMLCEEIIRHALTDSERDFNQSVYYGLDTDAGTVASDARSYPMMAERRLVVLKEAQNMKTLEDLGAYAAEPLESTVLVILMHGASADKRRSLYKNVQKNGFVLDSPQVRDYEMPEWISAYFRTRGIAIDPQAAALLGEYAGTDLGKIAVETDKMLKSLPEGVSRVTAEDIEKNVGISRQYSIFADDFLILIEDCGRLRLGTEVCDGYGSAADLQPFLPDSQAAFRVEVQSCPAEGGESKNSRRESVFRGGIRYGGTQLSSAEVYEYHCIAGRIRL